MGVRKTHIQQSGYYFITFTNYNWMPLIALSNAYDLVYQWFDDLKRAGHAIVGYVIMPNHIHLMLHYQPGNKSINTLVGNGKRFLAYGIISRLQDTHQNEIVAQLGNAVPLAEHVRGKKHQVFKKSFDLQHCYSQKFILQKLVYMHNNPCTKKWQLAANTLDYPHSSASFYFDGKQTAYPVISWLDIEANSTEKE